MEHHVNKYTKTKLLPYILLAVGAGVLLLLLPKKGSGKTETKTGTDRAGEYRAALESEIEALLGAMDGVKNCDAVVLLDGGFEYIYATDQSVKEQENGKETTKTLRLADGTDGQTAVLLREKMPKVSAVGAVLPGADEKTLREAERLLVTLFGEGVRVCVRS